MSRSNTNQIFFKSDKYCIDVKVGAHYVRTELDIYTGFIPTQLMTNTSGCCYNL